MNTDSVNAINRRKISRTTVKAEKEVDIQGTSFRLNDISSEGFGIAVDGQDDFFLGQRIRPIRFEGEETAFSGIVSHITKNEKGFACGIRFVFEGGRDFESVKRLVGGIQHIG